MPPNKPISIHPVHPDDFSSIPIKEKNGRLYKHFKNSNVSELKTSSVNDLTNFMSSSTSDENDGGNKGVQGNSGGQDNSHNAQGSSSGSSGREDKRNKPPEPTKATVTHNEEDMKIELKRIKTFNSSWPHTFLSPEALAAAGFYYLKDDIVRCPFCKIEVGRWEEEDIPKKEHRRWSGSCPFIRGIPCGNVPINASGASGSSVEMSEDVSAHSYDTCGIHEEMRPFAFCDNEASTSSTCTNLPCIQSTSLVCDTPGGGSEPPTKQSLEKLCVKDFRAPVYMQYSTEASRLASYTLWPVSIKQRPNALSEAGFYYTGNGDQTVCFHCGGGLKDWEEGDDPWVEHAKWFSKCYFLNLVKGSEFVAQVTGSRPALLTAEEVRGLSNQCSVAAGQETASNNATVAVGGESSVVKSGPSHMNTTTAETTENSKESKEIKDEGRLCKICYNAELGVVFLPCGHMVACVRCAPSLTTCPVCRQPFSHTVRAFLS